MAGGGSGKWRDDDVARTDRRWFLAAAAVFTGSLALFLGARVLYQVTGPHPEVTVFIRRIKSYANKLLRHRLKKRQAGD